ncbi:MAG: acyl-CoA dehydrogenase, partial [Acidimicrobiia bacterium]|nr:acyl-CoA dehydrogenase [Acidimicrobiia bacterium]
MSHYKSNLRDLRFNLFETLRIQDYLGTEAFPSMDADVADDVLVEVERLASDEFAASFTDADRNPPTLEDGVVTLPDSLKKSLHAYFDGGWQNLGIPTKFGGFGSPDALRWAAQEMLVGANPAAYFYASGTLMAVVLGETGTPEQVERFVKPMLDNNWGGTMVLTEPDAGSDVGSGTSKAVHIEGDTYHLEGVKRFITSGEHDFAENIIHLVLARREGGEPGTKGLSMFIVPKFLVNDDGSLGERNGIVATNLEKKMGIKASTTCELTMGMDEPCVGYLVGGVHQGIRQMFHIIEDARLLIGTKSAATLSTGYLNALEYANERIQSADMTEMADKTAPRVPIIDHPNVRRLLMTLKAYSEGLRAMFLYTAWTNDQAKLAEGDDATDWERRSDLLLPLLKGYASEVAYDQLGQALQVFGGSGFTQDYPLEQYIRDVKIDSLYEGTTGIQSLDLFFRKIAKDRGATLTSLAGEILETVKGGGED